MPSPAFVVPEVIEPSAFSANEPPPTCCHLANDSARAVEDRAVALGLAGLADAGLLGGLLDGRVLALVDDPFLEQPVEDGRPRA